MSIDRWVEVRRVVEAALDRPLAQRPAFLQRACAADVDLLARATELIGGAPPDGFLSAPQPAASVLASAAAQGDVGSRIGAYRLVELIAIGGMGGVYRAVRDDREFEKQVAVKLLAAGWDSPDALRRFHRERQLLARLEHPHITRLLDGGTTPEGRPYIVMEYVDGQSITAHCAAVGASLRSRLELFARVCAAVHHAHQSLVLHCDLKPGNILVDSDGNPKLLDFGVSKLLPEPDVRHSRAITKSVLMTVRYSSPEQIRGESVTTVSDVYSLGLILHELLTGEPPHRAGSLRAMVRAICDEPAPRPTESGVGDAELDALVGTALAKRPADRYPSAEALAADIRRYLCGDPIAAHPDTRLYRLRKACRRHRRALVGLLAFGVVVTLFAVASTVLNLRLAEERERAELALQGAASAHRASRGIAEFLSDLMQTTDPVRGSGGGFSMLQLLRDAAARLAERQPEPAVEVPLRLTLGRASLALHHVDDAEAHAVAAVVACGSANLSEAVRADVSSLRAQVHVWRRELAEAEAAYREALAMRQHGGDLREVLDAQCALAGVLCQRDRIDEADALLTRALRSSAALRGIERRTRAAILGRLAAVRAAQQSPAQAIAFAERGLALRRDLFGDVHDEVADGLDTLGAVCRTVGETDRALATYRSALSMRESLAGIDHPATLPSIIGCGFTLQEIGSHQSACDLLARGHAIAARALPAWHPTYQHIQGRLGHALLTRGRYAEAEPLLVASYEQQAAASGPEHLIARQLRTCLATLYESWGKPALAAQWR